MSIRIAFLSANDPGDIRAWSGIPYHMTEALRRRGLKVDCVGPLKSPLVQAFRVKKLMYRALFGKTYLRHRSPFVLRSYAQQSLDSIRRLNPDIVMSPGTLPIALLDCPQPIIFWTGATFAAMKGFYPQFSNLCKESENQGNLIELSALHKAALAVYASDWAARSASENYSVDADRLMVLPFGANIDEAPGHASVNAMISARHPRECRLLFLGVDWQRKGGELALAVAGELNQAGLRTQLTIVGCDPPKPRRLPDYVVRLGFISKATREGRLRLKSLLASSHFLIAPARAECFGIALAEANAFGVPALATAVGGIPSVIREGRNGFLFDLHSDASDYCAAVLELFHNYSAYVDLALSSYDEYVTRLNWDSATAELVPRLTEFSKN